MAYTSPKDMWNVPGKSEADSSGIHVSHISRVPYYPTRRVSPLRDDTLYRPEERTQETQETREPIHPRSWFYYRAPDIFESTAGLPSTADMPEDRQHRRLVPEADSRPPSFFWGEGLFVFPLTLVYTVISYTVLCGARSFGGRYQRFLVPNVRCRLSLASRGIFRATQRALRLARFGSYT